MKAGVWVVDETIVVIVALLVFLYVGYRRGVQRELPTLFGLGAGWFLASIVGPGLAERLNRIYKGVRFLAEDLVGREDSAAVWQRIRALPDPIRVDTDVEILALAVFVGVVGLVYILTQYRCRGAANTTGRVLGGLGGALNGLLFSRGVVLLAGRPTVRLSLPATPLGDVSLAEGNRLSITVVLILGLLIAFGVYSASSGAHRPD
ncbi:MAG: hypothetical protein GX657_01155 [Chloroflexi bacterium]|nr:hypothetical protein [Chloroflexota bacterium]